MANTATKARDFQVARIFAFKMTQLAFGETWPPLPPRWRRCLITTAPIEIAASAAITIRIGTRGEDEESSCEEVGLATFCCSEIEARGCLLAEPLPWLPWPEPPPCPVLELLVAADDELPEDPPDPDVPVLPEGVEPPVEVDE